MDGFDGHNRLYDPGRLYRIKAILMMDYILISLALVVCLVMWWSFLAVSGLKRSRPGEQKTVSALPKK